MRSDDYARSSSVLSTCAISVAYILDPKSGVPLHRQLRTTLQEIIEEFFENESPFMTEDYLVENLDVSRTTIRRALLDLTADGFLASSLK